MVGIIEKPEHITTQWFKDEGDAIVLLGEIIDVKDPLLGLGGSGYLQTVHGQKTGLPPRCYLENEQELQLACRALIHAGMIKSAHDTSEGGLAVALAECCISQQIARETPRLIGATIDLTPVVFSRLDALLFGETQGRIVVTTKGQDAVKLIERAKLLGVPAYRLGHVGGSKLSIKTSKAEFEWETAELHNLWWNSIARAMAS
jgi:phosphoribosylformylglycinamidine synthase